MDNPNSIRAESISGKLSRAQWLQEVPRKPRQKACIVWPFAIGKGGYGNLNVDGRFVNAHRLICEMVHGQPSSSGLQAAHSCGNRACVNPAHLSWKTPAQNNADKEAHGTTRRGPKSNLQR